MVGAATSASDRSPTCRSPRRGKRLGELRKVARDGGDPRAIRDKNKVTSPTFAEAARHVFNTRILPATTKPESMAQWLGRLERHAFPKIGSKPVHNIAQADVLAVLEPVWLTHPETARRVRQRMALIFDWGRDSRTRHGEPG